MEYYGSHKESLDQRFLMALNAAISLIQGFPGLGAHVHKRYRRFIVHRFPYSIIYREHSEFLRVVAVIHHKLGSEGWIGR